MLYQHSPASDYIDFADDVKSSIPSFWTACTAEVRKSSARFIPWSQAGIV
jgi:hypothetical protein